MYSEILFIVVNDTIIFFYRCLIYAFQSICASNITPKNRVSVTSLIDVLPMDTFMSVLSSMGILLTLSGPRIHTTCLVGRYFNSSKCFGSARVPASTFLVLAILIILNIYSLEPCKYFLGASNFNHP